MVRPQRPRAGTPGHGPHKLPPVPRIPRCDTGRHHGLALQGAPRRIRQGPGYLGGAAAPARATASVHDSQVDLSRKREGAYLDKAYFGVEIRGFSAAMRSAVRGRPLDIWDRLRNRRINRKRAPGGEAVCRDQADVRLGARGGDDDEAGAREDGFRVSLLQPGSAGHAGGEVVAWSLDVSRERAEGWWRVG